MLLTTSNYPTIFRREEVLDVFFVFDLVLHACLFHFLVESHQYALPEQYTVVILLESHVVYTTIINREYLPILFDLQLQLSTQVQAEHIQDAVQLFLAFSKHHNVIHVSEIVGYSQVFLNPMIKVGQIEVGQILTCEVADRQSLFLTVTINYLIQQPQYLLIRYRYSDNAFQYRVINIIIELSNVNL